MPRWEQTAALTAYLRLGSGQNSQVSMIEESREYEVYIPSLMVLVFINTPWVIRYTILDLFLHHPEYINFPRVLVLVRQDNLYLIFLPRFHPIYRLPWWTTRTTLIRISIITFVKSWFCLMSEFPSRNSASQIMLQRFHLTNIEKKEEGKLPSILKM